MNQFYSQMARCGCRGLLVALAATLLLTGTIVPNVRADTSVWEVSNGEHTIYLGGTHHGLPESEYPLPEAFERAFENSQQIYFEMPYIFPLVYNLEQLMVMYDLLTYHDGRTLKDVLSAEAYQALTEYLIAEGYSVEDLQRSRPGFVMWTIIEAADYGKSSERESGGKKVTIMGVEDHFAYRAMNADRPIHGLETFKDQIGALASLGEGNESEFVLLQLHNVQNIQRREEMKGLVPAWRAGDMEFWENIRIPEMLKEDPHTYDIMIRQRNLRWLPKIEAMFEDADVEYVLVGVGHMPGPDGLLELLQARGYTITQL
ncbi:MAG: TraB/GumN family protein [Pseudohongiellaceae bacterium]